MLAFDSPWEVIALIGGIVALRVAVPRLRALERWRAGIMEFVDSGLIAALLVFCILRPFVIQAFFIPSGSMEPTLYEGDRILVNKFIYFFREPRPGEIIVFNAPPQATAENKDFIKRCVAVGGDTIFVDDEGTSWLNGQALSEPYIAEPPSYRWPVGSHYLDLTRGEVLQFERAPNDAGALDTVEANPWGRSEAYRQLRVPEDRVVVFGDNRNDSNDSRRWERPAADGRYYNAPLLDRENVLGKAMVIFWPPQRIRIIR
jgi:signal peptidase I